MEKKGVSISIAVVLILAVVAVFLFWFTQSEDSSPKLKPYFSYTSQELSKLDSSSSNLEISTIELQKLDDLMFSLIKKNGFDAESSRVYAYVYVAQRDAAYLSHNKTGKWMGSVAPVTAQVLCLFFQKNCSEILESISSDQYSDALASIVIPKVKERIDSDQRGTRLYSAKIGEEYWKGNEPYFGQDFGSWAPWALKSSSEFRAPPPPAPGTQEWQVQLKAVQDALRNCSDLQKKAVVFWAGGPGTITPPGQWLLLTNEALWQSAFPLQKILEVRAVMAMGLADSIIAVFDSKYTYWIKRPFMLDSTLITIMPTPNHPSYPAGHAAVSGTGTTILSFYFPGQTKHWNELGNEASMSRTWGGIHFPLDSKMGWELGVKVGNKAINRER